MNNLYLFFIASIILNLTPGNDMLFVVSRTFSQGTKAGLYSALGIFTGGLVHICAAITGLSLAIANSAFLFEVIKWTGALYLIYLGINSLSSKEIRAEERKNQIRLNGWMMFKQGVLTNVLNPKVAIFFLSFLPQFIDPASKNVGLQLLALGLWFDIQGTIVLITLVFLISRSAGIIKENPTITKLLQKVTGLILIGLGLRLALESDNT